MILFGLGVVVALSRTQSPTTDWDSDLSNNMNHFQMILG